jgi:hypothetical protein
MATNCVHHWIIDNENKGRCRKCGEERDFGKLLSRSSHVSTSSVAALKRWDDPEYQAKQELAKKKGWRLRRQHATESQNTERRPR